MAVTVTPNVTVTADAALPEPPASGLQLPFAVDLLSLSCFEFSGRESVVEDHRTRY